MHVCVCCNHFEWCVAYISAYQVVSFWWRWLFWHMWEMMNSISLILLNSMEKLIRIEFEWATKSPEGEHSNGRITPTQNVIIAKFFTAWSTHAIIFGHFSSFSTHFSSIEKVDNNMTLNISSYSRLNVTYKWNHKSKCSASLRWAGNNAKPFCQLCTISRRQRAN